MTNRERLLAILDGQPPDRIPWIPRLQVWHTAHTLMGTLPERFRDLSLRQVEVQLRMGDPARSGQVYSARQDGDVEVVQQREGNSLLTTFRTPAGQVHTRHQTSPEQQRLGIGELEVEHMVKGPEDLAVVQYMVEHTTYAPAYDEYLAYETQVGDDGYPMVSAGDCPFHHFLQKLAGYQNGYYLLYDHQERVERLLRVMEEREREHVWPLVANSPARLILHGVHFGSTITPPPYFERYITPYYRDLSAQLRRRGKTLAMHADNDSRLILRHIEAAGFGMAETFTTAPQVSCTLEEARQAWGDRVIIWGAVPSIMLEPAYSEETFEAYMRSLFRTIAPGKALILGVADNIMPAALLHRLERIADMVDEWGGYPIHAERIP